MPVPPKFIVNLGAGFLTARTRSRLRRKKSGAVPAQQKTFRQLADTFAQTQLWREHGIEAGIDYKQFRERVPLYTYEDLAPAIERMKHGEADVLWPGSCAFYAISSGTTAGRTKYLPINGPMIAHFRKTGLDSLLYYAARTSGTKVFHGRHLFLGGSTALAPIEDVQPFAAYAGDLSGITALHLPPWVEKHLYEPGAEIAGMADWPEKIQAIVARTGRLDITLLAGIPSWILILAEALRAQAGGAANLQAIWPHLECLVHGGVPLGPFENELRAALGPTVNFHEVYPASEGFIAAQDADSTAGLRLFADAGLFFEFLPLDIFDENRLTILGLQAVPLEGVKPGVDYVLLLTTPAGCAATSWAMSCVLSPPSRRGSSTSAAPSSSSARLASTSSKRNSPIRSSPFVIATDGRSSISMSHRFSRTPPPARSAASTSGGSSSRCPPSRRPPARSWPPSSTRN